MRKLLFCLLPILGTTLEMQPWFADCLEFHFLGSYAYSFFNRVENGIPQLKSTFHSNVLSLGLDFSPAPEWSIDTDLQFADTSQQSLNFRSVAAQARYLWLDDIIGDPISFATGASARFTNTDSLHDVSCPYHANFDFELNFSFGKEFDFSNAWACRFWGYGALGQANRGSPWIRGLLALETNYDDLHKFGIFADGISGYGRHSRVFIDDFDGYAKIRQKAIDVGLRYGYRFGVYGTLRFTYARRILAKSCPEEVNTFVLSYLLPFSL